MMRIQPRFFNKVRESFSLHKLIDLYLTCGIVIEILKIHFKKMYFFFYFFKDDLIVPILGGLFEDSCKE